MTVEQGRGKELQQVDPVDIRTMRIVAQVVRDLGQEARGNYYNLVPHQYRQFVDGLVEIHYRTYENQFTDFYAFQEAMAQNWMMQFRASPWHKIG